jgi:hypothetical protein
MFTNLVIFGLHFTATISFLGNAAPTTVFYSRLFLSEIPLRDVT